MFRRLAQSDDDERANRFLRTNNRFALSGCANFRKRMVDSQAATEEELRLMSMGKLLPAIAVASILGAGVAAPAWSGGTRGTIQSWADQTAAQNGGVIREDAYLDEMGRRWDADPNHHGSRNLYLEGMRARWEGLDPSNRGLSPAQVSELAGNADASMGPTTSGTGVQAGNMRPGDAKRQ
jgi:hypothetical protein